MAPSSPPPSLMGGYLGAKRGRALFQLSSFQFLIEKRKEGRGRFHFCLGGRATRALPSKRRRGGSVPPRRGGMQEGGAAPPSRCVAAGWLLCWGGPHENPWRPHGASKGLGGICYPFMAKGLVVGGRCWSRERRGGGGRRSPSPPPPSPPPRRPSSQRVSSCASQYGGLSAQERSRRNLFFLSKKEK
nr:hypothetical protein [Morchella crassipes]